MSKTSKKMPSSLLDKDLLTDEDLMVIFGVSKTSLRRWRKKGFLHYFKFGTSCYYPSKLLKKIIKEQTYPPRKKKTKKENLVATNEKTNDKA